MKSTAVIVALLMLLAGVVAFNFGSPTIIEQVVGGSAGPDVTEHQYLRGGLTWGENCYATTTSGTITQGILDKNSCIYISPTGAGQAALTITLPASTTLSQLIPRAGNCQEWFIDGQDVAAATTTTIAAGTGINVVGLDATGQGTGADVIDGLEMGTLTLCRERNTDVTAFIEEWIHAD